MGTVDKQEAVTMQELLVSSLAQRRLRVPVCERLVRAHHPPPAKRSSHVTVLQPPEGLDGVDGVEGVEGVEGVDGVDGVEGVEGVEGVDPGVLPRRNETAPARLSRKMPSKKNPR